MKKKLGLFISLLAVLSLAGCKQKSLAFDKEMVDIECFSSRLHNSDGSNTTVKMRLQVLPGLSYNSYYLTYTTGYHDYRHGKFNSPIYLNFTYKYFCRDTVETESVKAIVYKIEGLQNEKYEQGYFLFGYNNPQVFFTNETVNNNFIENSRTLDYSKDKEGIEISVKSYPDFHSIELTRKGGKDAEWQTGEII